MYQCIPDTRYITDTMNTLVSSHDQFVFVHKYTGYINAYFYWIYEIDTGYPRYLILDTLDEIDNGYIG